jgi:O-antigen/teichoic acid export membrane protein
MPSRYGARSVLWSVAANMTLPVSSFLTAPLIARALGVADRGQYAALTSPTFLVAVIGTLGLHDAAYRGAED